MDPLEKRMRYTHIIHNNVDALVYQARDTKSSSMSRWRESPEDLRVYRVVVGLKTINQWRRLKINLAAAIITPQNDSAEAILFIL